MLTDKEFLTMSIDVNLFFLRIMKEHALFLQLGFTPRDKSLSEKAGYFNTEFNKLLKEAVVLGDGNVSRAALESMQITTKYTAEAEKLTAYFTGVSIDTELTAKEASLKSAAQAETDALTLNAVELLDRRAYQLTAAFADLKEQLYLDVTSCKIFTMNYPSLLKHTLHEAKLYMNMLTMLVNRQDILDKSQLVNMQLFWNHIMKDHSEFIAGLLDPSEHELIDTAEKFAQLFDELTAKAIETTNRNYSIAKLTEESMQAAKALRDFKAAGTKGILDCDIESVIIPLLADHVLREANHYICDIGACRY